MLISDHHARVDEKQLCCHVGTYMFEKSVCVTVITNRVINIHLLRALRIIFNTYGLKVKTHFRIIYLFYTYIIRSICRISELPTIRPASSSRQRLNQCSQISTISGKIVNRSKQLESCDFKSLQVHKIISMPNMAVYTNSAAEAPVIGWKLTIINYAQH